MFESTSLSLSLLLSRNCKGALAMNSHSLSTIKVFNNGLIEVSPKLSELVEDIEGQGSNFKLQRRISLSPFINNRTIKSALQEGFRLSLTRINTHEGAEFSYSIHNVKELLVPHQIEELLRKKALQNAITSDENRGVIDDEDAINNNWMQDPSAKDKTVAIYGEIVSATGFDCISDKLYVKYEVEIPKSWALRFGDTSDGKITNDQKSV